MSSTGGTARLDARNLGLHAFLYCLRFAERAKESVSETPWARPRAELRGGTEEVEEAAEVRDRVGCGAE